MTGVRVVFLAETYPKNMGYIGTMLPKYVARHGAEVHLIALDLPPYHYLTEVSRAYSQLAGVEGLVAGSRDSVDGFTVHVLGHRRMLGYVAARGLQHKLRELRPDVVYSLTAIGWLPLQALLHRILTGTPLFIGSHTAASMFPLMRRARPWLTWEGLECFALRWLPGRVTSLFSELCYAPTADCAEVAARFFGVQRGKLRVVHLGVDVDVFHPASTPESARQRAELRARLGFAPEDIVCVNTGKMSEAKNTVLLADAIEQLRARGLPFRGLFIGEGVERDAVGARPHSVVLELMPYAQLAAYYRAADIGVWPGTESTSMLDAAACGLPIVVSDRIYRDHVEGNGRVCRCGDLGHLVKVLEELSDPVLRRMLGEAGSRKMIASFNWDGIAAGRLADFSAALRRPVSQR